MVAGAIAIASCSSLNSGSSSGTGGKDAGAGGAPGSGGMVNSMGGSGTGGTPVDAAVDAPDNDAPVTDGSPDDTPVPCGPNNDCCPNDPNKTDPGQCGCGVPDTDSDSDGVAEFRIYSTARSAAQIAASFAAGPDTLPAN